MVHRVRIQAQRAVVPQDQPGVAPDLSAHRPPAAAEGVVFGQVAARRGIDPAVEPGVQPVAPGAGHAFPGVQDVAALREGLRHVFEDVALHHHEAGGDGGAAQRARRRVPRHLVLLVGQPVHREVHAVQGLLAVQPADHVAVMRQQPQHVPAGEADIGIHEQQPIQRGIQEMGDDAVARPLHQRFVRDGHDARRDAQLAQHRLGLSQAEHGRGMDDAAIAGHPEHHAARGHVAFEARDVGGKAVRGDDSGSQHVGGPLVGEVKGRPGQDRHPAPAYARAVQSGCRTGLGPVRRTGSAGWWRPRPYSPPPPRRRRCGCCWWR